MSQVATQNRPIRRSVRQVAMCWHFALSRSSVCLAVVRCVVAFALACPIKRWVRQSSYGQWANHVPPLASRAAGQAVAQAAAGAVLHAFAGSGLATLAPVAS